MINTKGFTLIELMIAVAIVGILAGIAYPSYQDSVRASRRADAKGALLGFANAMERYFTENNTYAGAATGGDTGTPAIFSVTSPVDGGTAYYNLTISAATARTYTLQATPINSQVGDGMMVISHTGVRGWDRNNDGDVVDTNENTWD
jgi:type IV pilus assembly protein PilE